MDDKMYYHASQVGGLSILRPRISNHGVPYSIYQRKEKNVLVYLSNAIENYCKETGFAHDGNYEKWGPYGFDKEGKLYIEEYKNAVNHPECRHFLKAKFPSFIVVN